MKDRKRTAPEPEPQEPALDAFKPVARGDDTGDQERATGWWTAPPQGLAPERDSSPPSPPERPAAAPAAPPGGRRGRRRSPVLRAVLLSVAAVLLAGAAVGVQWWDRSRWVAERYPAEVITDVGHDQTGRLRGVGWQVGVRVRPPAAGQDPAVTTLAATVLLTPDAAALKGYHTPDFEARDQAGHRWRTVQEGIPPTSLDLKAGVTSRFTVVATVPNAVAGTARLVLAYSPAETLRFAR